MPEGGAEFKPHSEETAPARTAKGRPFGAPVVVSLPVASVDREPFPGTALGGGDLDRAQFGGDFLPTARGFNIAPHCSNIEPLMCLDKIADTCTPAGIVDTHLEEVQFRFAGCSVLLCHTHFSPLYHFC